jgi:hypothetical protein
MRGRGGSFFLFTVRGGSRVAAYDGWRCEGELHAARRRVFTRGSSARRGGNARHERFCHGGSPPWEGVEVKGGRGEVFWLGGGK